MLGIVALVNSTEFALDLAFHSELHMVLHPLKNPVNFEFGYVSESQSFKTFSHTAALLPWAQHAGRKDMHICLEILGPERPEPCAIEANIDGWTGRLSMSRASSPAWLCKLLQIASSDLLWL